MFRGIVLLEISEIEKQAYVREGPKQSGRLSCFCNLEISCNMAKNSIEISFSLTEFDLVLHTDCGNGEEAYRSPLNGAKITQYDLGKMSKEIKVNNRGVKDFVQTIEIVVSGGCRVSGAYAYMPRFVFLVKIAKEHNVTPYSYCSGQRGASKELRALHNFMTQSWYAPEVVDYYSKSRRN